MSSTSLQGQSSQYLSSSAPLHSFDSSRDLSQWATGRQGPIEDGQLLSRSNSEGQSQDQIEDLDYQLDSLGLQDSAVQAGGADQALDFSGASQASSNTFQPYAFNQQMENVFININCKGHTVVAKIDPTAEYSVIKKSFRGQSLEDSGQSTSNNSTALGGRLEIPAGRRIYWLSYRYEHLQSRVIDKVVRSPYDFSGCDVLFGLDWIQKHGPRTEIRNGRNVIIGCQQTPTNLPQQNFSGQTTSQPYLYNMNYLPPVDENAVVDMRISGTAGKTESLDRSYAVQINPDSFFKPGRVFALLWHETKGANGTEMTNSVKFSRGKFGEGIYSSIRRMAVIKQGQGCSWCCPITTYSGQGVAKSGLTSIAIRDHTIVYMYGTQPGRKANEAGMTKRPIAVYPSTPREKLDQMSRLNFGKIYTVEHNVKVRDVGKVTETSKVDFEGYVTTSLSR